MLSKTRNTLITLLAAAAVTLLIGASTAHAEDEFKNAFEHQLGRIAAFEVAHLGKAALFGAYYHAPNWHARYHYRKPVWNERHSRKHRRHRGHRHDHVRHDSRGHDFRRHADRDRDERVQRDVRRHVHGASCDHRNDDRFVEERTVEKTVKKGRGGKKVVTTRRIYRDR